MLCDIDPTLGQNDSEGEASGGTDVHGLRTSSSLIEDLDNVISAQVLVSSPRIRIALRRLKILTSSHPNPGLTKRILRSITLPLWALSSWSDITPQIEENVCRPAQDLLRVFLQLTSGDQSLANIVRNLMFTGQPGMWRYTLENGDLSICTADKGNFQHKMPDLQVNYPMAWTEYQLKDLSRLSTLELVLSLNF